MIENKETAYCMAKLEDAIRAEDKSAGIVEGGRARVY